MSRIDLQIVGTANFAQIESAVNRLRSQLASINSMQMTGAIPRNAQQSIDGYLKTFRETIDASGMYQRQLVNITNETEKFGRSLERGNLRLGQLYKTAMDYRRTEIGQIRQLAREQVRMQNAVAISRGDGMAEVFVPRGLDEGIEKTRILSQEYRILRQVVRNGSTELINWGKNTQWAGRQLTVGLTVPITIFGAAAAKAFMDADKQLTRLSKVYGDAAKGMVSSSELEQIRSQALGLAQDIASGMGVSVTETLGIAADIAATGKEGNELLGATREAMRLSVLGEVDRQEAMRATLAIQTVFKQSTEGLADSINFLNAVENQTSTSLNDLVTGIVKAGPVVQGLGGDIEDLSLMMVAMREGGVPASEAANAIKSSLASLINPTKQTTQVLSDFGIDLKEIVDSNAGDVIGTLVDLQGALEGLDELSRQRSIEQIFGKFQFSRINALLNNLNKAGSQTEQVMALAELSATQLAQTAQRELEAVTESVSGRFLRAFESLKANLIPIGETFTEIGTIMLNVGSKILEVFNSLPDPVKNFFKAITIGTAVIGPLIMITGVLGNFFGYLVKGISTLMLFKKAGRGAFELLTPESAAATQATELLTESLFDQTVAVDTMAAAIDRLISKLESLQLSMQGTASSSVVADPQVLAGAEAAAMKTAPVATPYSTPNIPFARRKTPSEVTWTAGGTKDIQYSHLTAASRIRGTLGTTGKFEPMGMGSWVEGTAAEVQKGLKNFFADVAVYSEEIMTPEFRREELTRFADKLSSAGTINPDQYSQLITQIQSLSDQQLAQILPSWEKLNLQTSEYMSILSTAADGIRSENAETKAKVSGALEDYKRDSIDDPVGALKALKQDLTEAGLSVEARAEEISRELNAIRQEALEQYSDPEARQQFLEEQVSRRVIKPYELESFEAIDSEVKGFGGRSGYNKIMMATVQQLTDDMMNQSQMSDELLQAYQRSINAKNTLAEAEKAAADAANKSKTASEELAAAEQRAEAALQKAYSKPRDLSTATRNDQGQWEIDGQIVGQRQTELIAALDAREAALKNVTQTEIEGAASQERLIDAQDRNRQTSEMLDDAKEKEIRSKVRNIDATDKDTRETLESANSQNMQEVANKQNVNATQIDTKETREAAASENLQEIANKKNAGATGGGFMGKFGGGGRLTGLGAGVGSVLSMATMFMPTGDNEALNTATNILGGAGMGASMGAMAGPWGALAGGIIGAAIPAVTSFVDAQQKTNDALVAYGQSLSGASQVMEGFGSELGRRSPAERLAEVLSGLKIPQEQQQAAQSILQSETGQAMLSSARSMAGPEREAMLLTQLKQLTLTEIFTPEEAKAVAAELGTELGDPSLGQSLVNGILSVLDTDGKLIRDAISGQFIDTLPSVEEILSNAAVKTPVASRGGGIGTGVYTMGIDEITGKMSLMAGTLNQISEAEALVKLSFQNGEITRQQYVDQMSDINEKNLAAKETLESLMNVGTVNLIGAESILGDIASAQGVTEEFDKVVDKSMQIADLVGGTDVFRIPLETAAAYGQLASGELQQFQDMLMADPELQTTVTAIFDQDGSEEYALEIIRMINSGMDAEKVKLIIETEGVQEGIDLIDTFNMTLATLPPETQATIIGEIDYDPARMNQFISDYDYVNSLPDTNKELRAAVFGNDELVEIQANWEAFLSLPPEERKTAIMHSIYNIDYNYATTGTIPTANQPENFSSPFDAASMASAATSSSGGRSGGGSADTSGIDKQIEKQRELIDSIQEEREERQRLLDIQKESTDYALRQQDLENQIARARAEGNFAQAALLQAELDASKKEEEARKIERIRQEEEDRRIERAEKEIERLENQKSASSGGGGGDGGSGGISPEQQQMLQQRIQFINDELMAAIEKTGVAAWAQEIYENGASAFWDSGPVRNYIKAAKDAGVPIDVINQSLEQLFDNIVTEGWQGQEVFDSIKKDLLQIGISGDTAAQILPNVFATLNDPNLSKSEVIDGLIQQFVSAGDTVEEAERRANKFFNLDPTREKLYQNLQGFKDEFSSIKKELDPEAAKVIMEEYLSGINKGLSETDILENIRKRLIDAYMPELPEDMPESAKTAIRNQAIQQADEAINAIEGKLTEYTPTPVTIPVEPRVPTPSERGEDAGPTEQPKWKTAIDQWLAAPPTEEAKSAGNMVGSAIGEGIGEGLSTNPNLSSYWDTANSTLEEALKGYWQINSPSEKAKPIGSAIMEGIVAGMSGTTALSLVPSMMKPLIDSVKSTFTSGFTGVVDAYRILFSDPTNGLTAITDTVVEETSNSFYEIMTTRMQDTVDEINRIVSTNIKDYEFKIQGMPGVYIPQNLDSFWRSALPGVYDNLSNFGQIYRAEGGYVSGPGGPTEDKIPAWLSDGEYVIRASSVNKYGMDLLNQINAGKFSNGGYVTISNNTSPLGQSIANYAQQFTGTPYSANSYNSNTGPDGEGWGCATAMYWLYKNHFGISLPDTSLSANQWSGLSREVDWGSMLPGDLMYFYNPTGVNRGNPVNHTGMYVGGNQMFHASAPGIGTIVSSLGEQYRSQFRGARRVVPETEIGLQFPRRYKMGGKVYGNGGPTQDNILAMLSNGEYVMNAMSVRKYGKEFMDILNKGELAEAAAGGLMSKYPGYVAKMSSGGSVMRKYANGSMVNTSGSNIEYNINVNVAGTNASADEIADAVMQSMQRKERMNKAVTKI